MPNYINNTNRSFGTCNICGTPQYGAAKTYADITNFDGAPAVRVGDEVIADCGHSGFILDGSSILEVEGQMMATDQSQIQGDYVANFIESIETMGE